MVVWHVRRPLPLPGAPARIHPARHFLGTRGEEITDMIHGIIAAFFRPGGPYLFVRLVTAGYAISEVGRLIPVRRSARPQRIRYMRITAVLTRRPVSSV